MRALFDALEAATRRRGRVVELVGEPGMGKSRMVEELISQAGSMTLLLAGCELYETSSAYQPFRGLLRDVLGIRDHEDPIGAARRLRDRVEANAPHLLPWLPLLGIPMDIEMPMTPETEQLEEGFRRRRLEAVTEELLEWVLPTPTLFVFDDVHWMDEASADLLARMVAKAADLPWLILVTRRESEDGFKVPEDVRRPLAEPETARRRGCRPLPRDLGRGAAAAGTRAHGAGGAFGRQSAVLAGARRRGRVGHARAGVARHGRGSDGRRDRPARPDPTARSCGTRRSWVRPSRCPSWSRCSGGEQERPDELAWRRWATSSRRWSPGRSASVTPCSGTPPTRGCPTAAGVSSTPRRATPSRAPRTPKPKIGRRSCRCTSSTRTATRTRGRTRASRPIALEASTRWWMPGRSSAERSTRRDRSRDPRPRDRGGPRIARRPARPPRRVRPEAAASYRAARRLVAGDPLAESKLYLKEAWISDRVGHYRQGLRWVTRGRQALEGLDGQEAGRQRARLSAWYAALRQGQGRYREVMAWCELAIKEAEASGEREALAQAYFILDWALVDLGELEKATYSPRALEIYLELGNLRLGCNRPQQHGHVRVLPRAVGRGHRPVPAGSRHADQDRRHRRCGDGADEHRRDRSPTRGAWTRPSRCSERSCGSGRPRAARSSSRSTTSDLARVESRAGGCSEAMELYGDALRMFEEIGDDGEILETEARIAECRMLQGDLSRRGCCDVVQRARTIGGVPPRSRCSTASGVGPSCRRGGRTTRGGPSRRACEPRVATGRLRDRDGVARPGRARPAGRGRDEDAERESRTMLERLGVVRVAGVPALKGVRGEGGRARPTRSEPAPVPSACLHPGRRRPATATGTGDPRWTGPSSS